MSTSTTTPLQLATTSTSTPAPMTSQAPLQALIPIVLPHILSFLRFSFHVLLFLPKYTISLFTTLSHSAVITPLLYILAPIFTFASILFSITIGSPYAFLRWLLEAVYPLYVFCGVACITGGILGFGGRVVTMSIVKNVSAEKERVEKREYYEETSKGKEIDPEERSAKRRRVERDARLEVKFELDDDDFWYVKRTTTKFNDNNPVY